MTSNSHHSTRDEIPLRLHIKHQNRSSSIENIDKNVKTRPKCKKTPNSMEKPRADEGVRSIIDLHTLTIHLSYRTQLYYEVQV